ncbi:hypothetical protein bcgnr5378_38070 [Bacillus cereus]|uniref:Phr family secreted Rap phosphatase inhibitor n=1 Tax=Bacillus cereus TaxID=1396 RepID=A0A161ST13_BACCE|nr:hypothetical protein [Bacillus cereus]KZD71865.1 hypothetical protein B4088_0326 [Bacillus cereus]
MKKVIMLSVVATFGLVLTFGIGNQSTNKATSSIEGVKVIQYAHGET